MTKDIYVFIVEDEELARQMMKEHFSKDKFTYAEVFEEEKRERIVDALKLV